MIGTLRRDLLDHVIVLGEGHLRRQVGRYVRYYHGARTHLSLAKDAPAPRRVEPPELGKVIAVPEVVDSTTVTPVAPRSSPPTRVCALTG